MSKAQERAFEAYPNIKKRGVTIFQSSLRKCYQEGYEQATQDIIDIIWWRISEIVGDAQPKPILRAELEELIKRIKVTSKDE